MLAKYTMLLCLFAIIHISFFVDCF